MVFSCSSQQILLIPPYSGMQEGKVSETDRNPEEHWERSSGGFCWCCLLSWCWQWWWCWRWSWCWQWWLLYHLERRSRGFVAFLRPSVHPIQDEVNFTQFRMTWMSTLRQRSRRCRRSETPTWIILPSQMRLLSQVLWRKVRPMNEIQIGYSSTLSSKSIPSAKATTSKNLSWHLQQP